MNTNVMLNGIPFKNPIIAASGTFNFGEEYSQYFDPSLLGGIATTGITIEPKLGNKGIRVYETPSGMMNSIGLENPGIPEFLESKLSIMKAWDTNIIANLGGNNIEDYLKGAKLLNNSSVDMIELNISCPNVEQGGMAFGVKADVAFDVVKQVRKVITKPLTVKLSPNAQDIVEMAQACEEAGADSLSLVNTFNALAIDIHNRKPVFNNVTAGLSGPAIRPIALRMVWQVAKAVKIPVVGIGGITDYTHVIEYIMAGATCVQVGSANFLDPKICLKIISDLKEYMIAENINNLSEIRGII